MVLFLDTRKTRDLVQTVQKIITFCNKTSTDGFVISEFLPQHFVAKIIKQSSQIKT